MSSFRKFLEASGVTPETGKIYKVDWDGPSLAKVTLIDKGEITLTRVDKKGEPLKGTENQLSVTKSEWADLDAKIDTSIKPSVDLLSIADEAVAILKRAPEGRSVSSRDIDKAEMHGAIAVSAIRYWGSWSTPMDAEDDEDYDWQELSSTSKKSLGTLIDPFIKKHEAVAKIRVEVGEKNYIIFHVQQK